MPRVKTPGKIEYTEKELKDIYYKGYAAGKKAHNIYKIQEKLRAKLVPEIEEAWEEDFNERIKILQSMFSKLLEEAHKKIAETEEQAKFSLLFIALEKRLDWDKLPKT